MRATVFATTLIALGVAETSAQAQVRISVQVDPPTPEAGQVFRVIYSLRVNSSNSVAATPLDLGGLDVLSDPGPPQMPQMAIFGGGGMMMFNTSTEYAVRARRPGRFTIRGARAVDRQTGRVIAQSPAVTVNVVRTGSAPAVQPAPQNPMGFPMGFPGVFPPGMNAPEPEPEPEPQSYQGVDVPPDGRLTGAVADRSGFLRVDIDHPEPWVGQQVIWRAWIYIPAYEAGCESVREATYDGFWSEMLFEPRQACAPRWIPQRVSGTAMTAGMTRRVALYPTHSGPLTVGPLTLRIEYIEGDAFFGRRRSFEMSSPSITLTAHDPPTERRPSGWVPGTIGRVSLQASLDRTTAPVGETVTLTVRAQGNGYLGSVGLPPLATTPGVRVLPGSSQSQNDTTGDNVVGHLTNEYRLVADLPGQHSLGTLRVPWFDPSTRRYEITELVLPTLTATGEPSRPDPDATHEDPTTSLHPLRPLSHLGRHKPWFTTAWRVWAALTAVPFTLVVFTLGRVLSAAFIDRRRARRASLQSSPRELIRRAREALHNGDTTEGLSLSRRALDNAERAAPEGSIDTALEEKLSRVRQHCDDARFGGTGNATEVITEVTEVITMIEALS